MTPRHAALTSAEVISVLKHHGFVEISQKGSHMKFRNAETRHQVIVPYHQGKQLPLGTLKSIIEGSGDSEDEFRP
jgi:predicted RNA binding protein YcfA (HicA-like mRNA interferase family)